MSEPFLQRGYRRMYGWERPVLSLCLAIASGCGPLELRFNADKEPAANCVTLVEGAHATSALSTFTTVKARVTSIKPAFGLTFFLEFDPSVVDIAEVSLGSLFQMAPYLSAPADPTGLLQWEEGAQSGSRRSLTVTVAQDPDGGSEIGTTSDADLFSVVFYSTANAPSESHIEIGTSSVVFAKDGSAIIPAAAIRTGSLRLE